MSSGLVHLPQLAIQPQQPTDPLETYSKLLSVQRLGAQQQLQQSQIQNAQLETQERQLQVAQTRGDAQDAQTMRSQAPNFVQKDESGKVTGYDSDGYFNSLIGAGVPINKVSAIRMQNAQMSEALAKSGKANIDLADAKVDNMYNILEGVRAIAKSPNAGPNTVQGAYQDALPRLQQLGVDTSKYPQQFAQVGDEGLQRFEAELGAHKQIIADAYKQAEIAEKTTAASKNLAEAGNAPTSPLGDKVQQLNQALASRYAVLNPGKPLPPPFTLGPNATRADFDRVDKIMEATEKAQGTKAQQDTSNALREQTFALTKGTKDLTPVIGQDAQGNDVLVPKSESDDMGLKNPMKAGEQEVSKAQSARHWIPLATAQGDPKNPDTMGILPLIDKLDQEGKLGVVASRWNDFLAGKVGAADPYVTALRGKMGLSTTLLMNAHVGNRGGSYMLEHFQDLADAGKMDASTLRTGVKTELNYIEGRAMLPKTAGSSQNNTPPPTTPAAQASGKDFGAAPAGKTEGATGKLPDGTKVVVKGGRLVAQ